MSYVDAKRVGNSVFVSERLPDGKRRIQSYKSPLDYYTDYTDDELADDVSKGIRHIVRKSMFGDRVRKRSFNDYNSCQTSIIKDITDGKKIYESDIRPEYKVLERNYEGQAAPNLHVAIYDIEVAIPPKMPWARYENPYAEINAITIYQKWLNKCLTYALAPPGMTVDEAQAAILPLIEENRDIYICQNEAELLELTLEAFEDADVISGWNDRTFDLPYIIQRTRLILGEEPYETIHYYNPSPLSEQHLKRLCLFHQSPRMEIISQYGRPETVFSLCGRVQLDYLDLYKTLTFSQKPSYSLDYILSEELQENKVAYKGTLYQLWCEDFATFIRYSIQDVMGLSRLDDKMTFIRLASEVTHMACVNLIDALGSVSKIENAIIVALHKKGMVAPDKKPVMETSKVAGGFVHMPKGRKYNYITSFDLNSLYPSVIRLLNISPETVVGQFDISRTEAKLQEYMNLDGKGKPSEQRTRAWHNFTGTLEYHDIVDGTDELLTLVYEDGEKITMTGAEWREIFRGMDLTVSANGTVFRTDQPGIIPEVLAVWYQERIETRKKSKDCYKAGDTVGGAYWDMVQQVRKVYLNATYGALLNAYFRFNDPRFGQSVTLSGRVVTKHMARKACEIIDGRYEFTPAMIYSDTDSGYFELNQYFDRIGIDKTDIGAMVDECDRLGELINASFPEAMERNFFSSIEHAKVIECKRETVARNGLFKHETKKRYALNVWDDEGKRYPDGKVKVVGMEVRRSDTPKFVQKFLQECLEDVLIRDYSFDKIYEKAEMARDKFDVDDPFDLGIPSSASKITIGKAQEEYHQANGGPKPKIHWAVMGALRFNQYREFFGDTDMREITDGDKVKIFYLNQYHPKNPLQFPSIAINADATFIKDWFSELPFDIEMMKQKLIANKLNNVFDMLDWDFDPPLTVANSVFVYD